MSQAGIEPPTFSSVRMLTQRPISLSQADRDLKAK